MCRERLDRLESDRGSERQEARMLGTRDGLRKAKRRGKSGRKNQNMNSTWTKATEPNRQRNVQKRCKVRG